MNTIDETTDKVQSKRGTVMKDLLAQIARIEHLLTRRAQRVLKLIKSGSTDKRLEALAYSAANRAHFDCCYHTEYACTAVLKLAEYVTTESDAIRDKRVKSLYHAVAWALAFEALNETERELESSYRRYHALPSFGPEGLPRGDFELIQYSRAARLKPQAELFAEKLRIKKAEYLTSMG